MWLQNDVMTKWQVYYLSNWQNDTLTERSDDWMMSWQNEGMTNCQIDKQQADQKT